MNTSLPYGKGCAFALARVMVVCFGLLSLVGCGQQWQDTVHTAEELSVALCKDWVNAHPQGPLTLTECDVGGAGFADVVALIEAKRSAQDAKDALIAHPPLSSAAALAVPCLAQPTDPQSRLDLKLMPYVTEPPVPGE